jgi:toxin ParE1/3/4
VSYRVLIEPAAAGDIEEAFRWYEARRTGLGAEFVATIAVAFEALTRDPAQFALTRDPFRWIKLRKFPYAIHYRIKGDTVAIAACLHFRQSPKRWPGT